jgi:excinuclease ABC subunit A
MSDSIQTAFFEGDGKMIMEIDSKISITFSNKFEKDGLVFEEPAPNLFSFNNPFGACPTCEGYAQVLGIDPDLVIPNKALSLFEDAVAPWKGEKLSSWKEAFIRSAKHFNFPIHKAIQDLTDEQKNALWYGNEYVNGINDFFKEVEQNLYKVQYRVMLSRYRGRTRCTDCGGFRLRKEALYVKINEKHIGELNILPAKDLMSWIKSLKLSEHDKKISEKLGYVLCGGDLSAPTEVSEQYLLDLEREAFLSLCGEKKPLERIQSILTTGKVLRN